MDQLKKHIQDIVDWASEDQCTEYAICTNRGEKEIDYCSKDKDLDQIIEDLQSISVSSVNNRFMSKIYYHSFGSTVGVMVIGVLTSDTPTELIVERV